MNALNRATHRVYFPPTIHLCICLVAYGGMWLAPRVQQFGILWMFILMADFPISISADHFFGENAEHFVVSIFAGGTIWWYLLSRFTEALYLKFFRSNQLGPD